MNKGLTIVVLAIMLETSLSAQGDDFRSWIKVENDRHESALLNFGNNSAATYGIDPELGEMEGPPLSPAFDVRWVNTPGRPLPSYGMGLLYNDFVPCPSNSARKDTFVLLVSDGMENSGRWIFTWPDEVSQRSAADSMFLVDPLHPGRRINMITERRYVVDTPDSPVRMRIYKYGGCPCVIVRRGEPRGGGTAPEIPESSAGIDLTGVRLFATFHLRQSVSFRPPGR